MEFEVADARPVDVFNVLFAVENETKWDTAPKELRVLGDWKKYQARGTVGFFDAAPLSTREIWQWQVVSANFTTQEFWVVYTSLETDELRRVEPLKSGATEMQNCMCSYKITLKEGGGAHVINSQQVNEHPWPLSARFVANAGWQMSVAFGKSLRLQSEEQAKLGWAFNETKAPAWMLKDRDDCALPKEDEGLREQALARAATGLNGSWQDPPKKVQKLSDGQEMRIWQNDSMCKDRKVPLFTAEFVIAGAGPVEAFNAIAAKREEARWNPQLKKVNITGFSRGARGVHEEFATPSVLGLRLAPRELWEWQAANHTVGSETYILALNSEDPFSPAFEEKAVVATQCIAAFEVGPDGAGNARIRMAQHLNPNAGMATRFPFLWEQTALSMLAVWAEEVSVEARNLVAQRHCGKGSCDMPNYDAGVLRLLSPSPLNRNESATIHWVLSLAPKHKGLRQTPLHWQRGFAALDLPKVLNVSDWPADAFSQRAGEVLSLYHLVQHNATEAEAAIFVGQAKDALAVQRQGEALAGIQMRYLEAIYKADCDSNLPDINGDKGHRALPFWVLVSAVVVLLGLVAACFSCCCVRACRRRRERRARQAASLLLSTASSTAISERDRGSLPKPLLPASEVSTASSSNRQDAARASSS
mmetsp:Transcript_40845/g.94774  ORF Transcript_40845/g.94774 Transcript_40845/m.94774 type:complete len:646 (+) Transcript_40845:192-2129(+)